MLQIDRGVPAGIVFPVAVDGDILGPFPKLMQSVEGAQHLVLAPDNANQVLHHFLQVMLNLVRPFGVSRRFRGALERFQRLAGGFFDFAVIDADRLGTLC